ncbi:PAS domain S-box-containing protein/diguanylate cyclase (GGDEF) domain-containing protein [Kushneria avicenniae]|uniref:PAS domain S-box-containing protein/diguanylate cyclase (GGDEF) domain-containing protein n=1 Tax=Kushneria avicenniae TaxID=402385 RepID=A0A1I1ID24_9GAMM|nr:diguanylate cyclase [Kushneria avicenniae]SFC32098.1 PAS domain S-box-containing protein/diguanylate cyclase (GGDEF) domain-containing protein [Kushneria avicenniae]
MKCLSTLAHSRLALRAAAAIMLIVGLLGVCFLHLAVHFRAESEKDIQQTRLEGLVSTVERTAQIACFLEDTQLASEVTQGLLSNRIVRRASLSRNDGSLLADHITNSDHSSGTPLTRQIASPFEPDRTVCQLTLVPDQDWIDGQINEATRFLSVALLLQLLCIGLSVILVVFYFVTRPISDISQKLHALEAETGQKLATPGGHRRDEIGRLVTSVNTMIDRLVNSLSEERRQRLAREVEERRYRTLFDNVEVGIFELDDQGRLLSANPAFCRLFMAGEPFDIKAQPRVFTTLISEGGPTLRELTTRRARRDSVREWEMAVGKGDQRRWVNVMVSRLEEGRLQGVAHDITERRRAAEAAEKLAVTDPLTGLGNRLGFERRLSVIERYHRLHPDHRHALMMLDFDHFKQINDAHGHHAGDEVLRQIADILRAISRQHDFSARLGGDEFVVLLDHRTPRDDLAVIAQGLINSINQPLTLQNGQQVRLGISIGIAILGSDTRDVQTLVQLADKAMYRAKREGRNTLRFHDRHLAFDI